MPNVIVSAVSEWNGKALKKGQKEVNAFEKSVNKLGKAFLGVFATQKIMAFGKASVQAFLDDEKAAASLTQAVKNLGLSLSNVDIADFVGKLEKQSNVADDLLRPSLQKLLTTTGDAAKSQELLTQAIDISRGSGVELSTVTQDLANGYVGITRGLRKYNLGLTQSQLKTMKFEELMRLLNKQFNGASAAYLATYAGQLETVTRSADRAKETIGKGLIDSLLILSGNTSAEDLADDMEQVATNTAAAIVQISKLIKLITAPLRGAASGLTYFIEKTQPFADLIFAGDPSGFMDQPAKRTGKLSTNRSGSPAGTFAKTEQARKAKAAADAKNLQIQRELNKLAAAKALKDKLAAQNAKLGLLFNQTAISATAALKNKLSDEERNKVELLLALEMENTKEAERLAQKVALASDETGLLAQFLRTLPDARNPFGAWNSYLKTLEADSLASANAIADAFKKAYDEEARLSRAQQTNKGFANFENLTVPEQITLIDSATVDALAAAAAAETASKAAQDAINKYNSSPLLSTLGNGGYGQSLIQEYRGYGASPASMSGTTNYNITLNNPVGNDIETMVQNAVLNASRLGNNLTPAGYAA